MTTESNVSKGAYLEEVLNFFGEGDTLFWDEDTNTITFKNSSGCLLSMYNVDTQEVIHY